MGGVEPVSWLGGGLFSSRRRWSSRSRIGAPAAQRGRTTLTRRTGRAAGGGLAAGPVAGGWGRAGRDGVDRPAARLMFAGRDRRSAMRRLGPLTERARGCGHSRDGDRSCSGGGPARGGFRVGSRLSWVGPRSVGLVHLEVWVISAQMNPASSRAIAVTTMFRLVLRASRRRNRPHSRSCAVQARATPPGVGPVAAGDLCTDGGPGLVGPGGLDQLGAQVQVPGLGDVPAAGALPGGVLAGHQPAEPHECARPRRTGASHTTSEAKVSAPRWVIPR